MNELEHLVSSQNRLGETPIWSSEENALYWVDWGGEPTCRFELATSKLTTFPVSVPVANSNRQVGSPPQSTQYKAFSSGFQIGVSPSRFCDDTRCSGSFMTSPLLLKL